MLLPERTVVVAVFVTDKSALVLNVVVDEELLFAGLESIEVEDTVAVFVTVDPPPAAGSERTTSVKVADSPGCRLGTVQFTIPFAPTAGVVQVAVRPEPWAMLLKLRPAGSVSLMATLLACASPLFVAVIV